MNVARGTARALRRHPPPLPPFYGPPRPIHLRCIGCARVRYGSYPYCGECCHSEQQTFRAHILWNPEGRE